MNKKIIKDAAEMTKGIPAKDILVPMQLEEDTELTPYPAVEYDVIMHYKLDKLIKDVNAKLEQWWQTEWWIQVSNWASVMYYQTLIRWNVDWDKTIHIPGLEDEPDLYEDIDGDGDK